MPLCIICNTKFFEWSWSAPPEDCDCGQCISKRAAQEMQPRELDEAYQQWVEKQQKEKES